MNDEGTFIYVINILGIQDSISIMSLSNMTADKFPNVAVGLQNVYFIKSL